jgi:hypothetical protein
MSDFPQYDLQMVGVEWYIVGGSMSGGQEGRCLQPLEVPAIGPRVQADVTKRQEGAKSRDWVVHSRHATVRVE